MQAKRGKSSTWDYFQHQRSMCLIVGSLAFLFMFSAFSVLLSDEVLSTLWTQLAVPVASVLRAQVPFSSYQNSHQDTSIIAGNADSHVHEDPTCLSRTQQYLYRNSTKAKPIPTRLLEEWEKYAQLHKSCSRQHSNWTASLKTRAHGNGLSNSCKYLIYMEGREGLGNGILSLTSAFTFALATGRVLMIDSRKNIAKLLCEPFPGSSWVLPDDFPYEELEGSPSLGSFTQNKDKDQVTAVRLNLQHTLNGQDQQIFCEQVYSSLANVTWVAWESNQYFFTNFMLVPSFWQRLEPIVRGYVGHIFTYISRLLLLPANDTWAIVLREYWSYLSSAKSKLGVQVRLHGRPNLAEFDPTAHGRIMECLVSKGLLPSMASQDNITELQSLYGRKMQASGGAAADVAVLVASLQGKYAETMKQQFGQMPTKDTKMVRLHSVSQQGFENKGFNQAQLAFVEMWLLSYCDSIATSPFSTFGYVAQGLGDLYPYILILDKPPEGQKDDKYCLLGQSVEPCTHYPRTPPAACSSSSFQMMTEEHKLWIHTHFRSCQDRNSGWQLFDPQLLHSHPLAAADAAAPVALDFLPS